MTSEKTIQTSRALGWQGIVAETCLHPGGEADLGPSGSHHFCLNLGASFRLEHGQGGGLIRQMQMPHGFTALVPAGQTSVWRSIETVHHLHLYLSTALLDRTAEQMALGHAGTLAGLDPAPFHDPHIEQIAGLLRLEMESGAPQGGLYAETLASALSVRLLQREHDLVQFPVSVPSAAKVRVELQKAIAYIQDNLAAGLSLDSIAREAGLSSYHFARLFTEAFGISPHQYVIQARVEWAKALITREGLPLGDAAQRVGFSDQSHLNRHFKRLVGITPHAFVCGAALQRSVSARLF